jgi:hypothetical protein
MPLPSSYISLDPESASLPTELGAGALPDPVHLAFLADAELGSWGGRAVLALARGWAASGRTVTVMDADVRHPTLHRMLKVGEGEGVTDALLYGASPALIVRDVPGEPFRFIGAGTAIGDPEALWQDTERWSRLLTRIQHETGGTLLVLLPEEAGAGVVEVYAQYRIGRGGVTRDDDLPLIHPPGLGAPRQGSTAPDPLTAPEEPVASQDPTAVGSEARASEVAAEVASEVAADVAPAAEVAPEVAPAPDAPAEVATAATEVATTTAAATTTDVSPTPSSRPSASPLRASRVTVPAARAKRWTAIYLLVTLFVFLTLAMVVGAQSYGFVDIPGLEFIPRLPLN